MTNVGRYRILREIGRGGMGAVYEGHDPVINRSVAIKLLSDQLDDAHYRQRFLEEARNAGRLSHPNIVTIHECGEHEGVPFIVMELVDGETLQDLIRSGVSLSLSEKLGVVEQLCAGLGHAHRSGIVHRDIKPANVMRDVHGVTKILDFGIAKSSDGLTRPDELVLGTLRYAAPEKLSNGAADHRLTDQFSAGLVAYELLSGQAAFGAQSPSELMAQVLKADMQPLSRVAAGLGRRITDIVDRALKSSPLDRFPDMLAFESAVSRERRRLDRDDTTLPIESPVRADTDSDARRAPSGEVDAEPRASPALSLSLGVEQTDRSSSLRSLAFGLGAAVFLIVVIVGGVWMTNLGRTGSDGSLPPAVVRSETGAPEPDGPPLAGRDASVAGTPSQDAARPRESGDAGGLRVASGPSERTIAMSEASPSRDIRDILDARNVAQLQLDSGDREAALLTILRGLQLAEDPQLQGLLLELSTEARELATEARRRALEGDAPQLVPDVFAAAARREQEAQDLGDSQRTDASIRAFWQAEALFVRARSASDSARASEGVSSASVTDADVRRSADGVTGGRPSLPNEEQTAVSRTLERYLAAYSSLSAAAVKTVRPSLTTDQVRALDRTFIESDAYELTIADVQRSVVDETTVRVTGRMTHVITPRDGDIRRVDGPAILTIQKLQDEWVVTGARGPLQ